MSVIEKDSALLSRHLNKKQQKLLFQKDTSKKNIKDKIVQEWRWGGEGVSGDMHLKHRRGH